MGKEESKKMAELGSKGGLVKSKIRNASISLSARKFCNSKCPVYPCLYAPLNKEIGNGDKRFRCAVKDMDPKIRLRLARLMLNGGDGVIKEIQEVLVRVGENVSGTNIDELKTYFEMLMKFRREVFGEDRTTINQTVNIINFGWGKELPQEKLVEVEAG